MGNPRANCAEYATGVQFLYLRTRITIECTDIFTEKPSSLSLASKTFFKL